jgi:RNA-directed DNA polymerase
MRAKLKAIKEELRRRMHEPIPKQEAWLRQVVRGFFAYHAVPTNSRSIGILQSRHGENRKDAARRETGVRAWA